MRHVMRALVVSLLGLTVAASASSMAFAQAADPPLAGSTLAVRNLAAPEFHTTGLAPGDRSEWAAEVTNTGSAPSTLSIRFETIGDGALVTDRDTALQLVVDVCDQHLSTEMDAYGARIYTCASEPTRLGAGPAGLLHSLDGTAPVAAGGTVGVRVRIEFPAAADNDLENATGLLGLRFSIVDASAPVGGPGADTAGPVADTAGPRADTGRAPFLGFLALTGADVLAALAGAFIALAGGLVVALIARRRRSSTRAPLSPPTRPSPSGHR